MRTVIRFLGAWAVAASAVNASARQPEIWGKAIMPQPFDSATQPFRQIAVPKWVSETTGCGYTLSGADREARVRAVDHGVGISELGFVDPFYPYYDSKLLKRRSPHVPLGRLEQEVAEYKRLGIRILGVYPPCLQGEVYETHPEWRRIATNTKEIPQIDLKQHPYGGMLCLLGPYGDFFIEVLAEILTKFPDVDAFSFDGLHYGGVCYCRSCRDAYRKDAQAEIPNADLNDPAFRRYQHWADRRMENLVRRMQTRIKGIKPTAALVTWTTNAGRFGHFLSIPRNMPARMNLLLDAPDQEFWLDETNRGATIVPAFANAYIWATTNHRAAFSEPYLMSHGNPYSKDSFPPEEIRRRMLLAVTHGAAPSIAVGQPPRLQAADYEALDDIRKRKPWLIHKSPEPWAALLMSDNTRNFYGRSAGLVEKRYLANVFGAFRAALEEHLPITVINDWNLTPEDLKPYQVLILPNAACLDDRQIAAVDRYVQNGGGLVASLDASLCDEFGDPRSNFGLASAFGADHRGLIPKPSAGTDKQAIDENFAKGIGADYWEKRENVFNFKIAVGSPLHQGRSPSYLDAAPVVFKGPAVHIAPRAGSEAQVWGTLQTQSEAPASQTAAPAVIARSHGKGRVVYFAAGFDAAYYLYPYPYQRLLLKNAVEWVAAAPPPIRVQAPMCVQATVMRQDAGGSSRLLIHLFNDLNTTAFHGLPNDDVPLREETVPIHDIRLTFRGDHRIRSVRLQPEGAELKIATTPEGAQVIVPRLDIHAIVVAELADGPG